MHAHEMFEVFEQLVDAHARGALAVLVPQNFEVAPGNLDAVGGLPRDDAQPVLDKFQILHLHPRRAVEPLVQHLHKTGDDRERPVDVMDDAGVNVAALLVNLPLDMLVLQFGQQLLDFLRAAVDFALERAALHRLAHGGAHRREVERLVDVIAGAQAQRFPDRVGRLKRRHHDRLHVRLHILEIVFVLENHPQRLARPVLVIHDQQGAPAFRHRRRRRGFISGIAWAGRRIRGKKHWKNFFLIKLRPPYANYFYHQAETSRRRTLSKACCAVNSLNAVRS